MRLRVLQRSEAPLTLHLVDGERHPGRLHAVGADWVAAQNAEAAGALIVPVDAVRGVETHHGAILDTLEDSDTGAVDLRARMTLGFLLRDFARRRLAVRVTLRDGERLHGTIDRAGE